jgi:formiminotetrahydrofolate cyclodeaminase
MNNSANKPLGEFIAGLSSREPVPGGGGAAALAGALGVALGRMVAGLTVGKEKYRDVEDEIIRAASQAETLTDELLALIDRDAEAFAPLATAYRLPSATEEERRVKEAVMEPALKAAALVPLEIMRKCAEAIALLEVFAECGSVMAVSDAACGAALAKAALRSAWLNVCVNTRLLKDAASAEAINAEGGALLAKYADRADEMYAKVEASLKC